MQNLVSLLGGIMALTMIGSSHAGEWEPKGTITPKRYICYRTAGTITIDGTLDESSWQQAPWTNLFVDIEGNLKLKPRFRTRAKMLWDDDSFYIGADLEEPDVWAALTERDAVIFQDNDFEVFIDPDGDTHEYYEFEINALSIRQSHRPSSHR